MTKGTRNLAASVQDRLLQISRESRQSYQYLLNRFSNEGFLYRLGASRHRDSFALKGATLFLR